MCVTFSMSDDGLEMGRVDLRMHRCHVRAYLVAMGLGVKFLKFEEQGGPLLWSYAVTI